MATKIIDVCVNSGDCVESCPNAAIIPPGEESPLGNKAPGNVHWIDPELCTECVGFYGYEMCASLCPVTACLPGMAETELVLIRRATKSHDPDEGALKDEGLEEPQAEDQLTGEFSHFQNDEYIPPSDPKFKAANSDRSG